MVPLSCYSFKLSVFLVVQWYLALTLSYIFLMIRGGPESFPIYIYCLDVSFQLFSIFIY